MSDLIGEKKVFLGTERFLRVRIRRNTTRKLWPKTSVAPIQLLIACAKRNIKDDVIKYMNANIFAVS